MHERVDVLGVPVSVCTYESATAEILKLAAGRRSAAVAACPVHLVMCARQDPGLRAALADFALVTPDGQPVRWAVNILGKAALRERVYGPDLMFEVCLAAAAHGVSVYLYGTTDEILSRLSGNLSSLIPDLTIAGAYAPPFRALTPDEDREVVERINGSGAGICFVALGCPTQEQWAAAHVGRVNSVMLCVGAAFTQYAGISARAPRWMQDRGLEWLFRLSREPRRLWSRYVINNPRFLLLLAGAWIRRIGA